MIVGLSLAGCSAPLRSLDHGPLAVQIRETGEAHAGFSSFSPRYRSNPGGRAEDNGEVPSLKGTFVDAPAISGGSHWGRPVQPGREAASPFEAPIPMGTWVTEGAPMSLKNGSDARCPAEMALVAGRVCVDRWEASLVVLEHGVEQQLSPFDSVDAAVGYRAVSRGGEIPQGYISGKEAEQACHASGKRLCTAPEWETGCRGSKDTQFPYGNERRAHVCNDDIRPVHPVLEAARKAHLPAGQTWSKGMQLPTINQLENTLLPAGERSECVTPEGLYDMVGNLHEWVADADGTFRGGFYMDTSLNGDGCSYQTTAHDFTYHDYSTGFRCCLDPDSIE